MVMIEIERIQMGESCVMICLCSYVCFYLYENSENGMDKERESDEFMEG